VVTEKVRSMLALAAAGRNNLERAWFHSRSLPAELAATRSALGAGATAELVALGARQQQLPVVLEELRRVGATLEPKQLATLLADNQHRGISICQEILSAATVLQVQPCARCFQVMATLCSTTKDRAAAASVLIRLVERLDLQVACLRDAMSKANLLAEPTVVGLLQAAESVQDSTVARRILSLYHSIGSKRGAKALLAACSVIVTCDTAEEACAFVEQELIPKGVYPTGPLAATLVGKALATGRDELRKRLEEHASQNKEAPTGNELQRLAAIIKGCAKNRHLPSAIAAFNGLRESGTPLNSFVCNCFLDACVQCGDIDRAISHFQFMKKQDFVDIVSYNTLLKAFLSHHRSQEAQLLVQQMRAAGFQPNKITYNELLNAKVESQDLHGVWRIVDEMKKAGVKANSVTCSILIKSVSASSKASDLKRITELVDESEDAMDEVLLAAVIEACVRIKQLDLLTGLLRRFRQRGGVMNLSSPLFGSMIKAYGSAGQIDRVKELWTEMQSCGVKPSSITIGCMVEAYAVAGLPEEAWKLVHSLLQDEERRGCINTVIYSTVLKAFASDKQIRKVFAVYEEMKAQGVPCNTITYNTLLAACAKCSAMSHAPKLLEDMKASGVEPDVITYSTMIKGFCMEGDMDRAFQVMEDMKSTNSLPDEITFNSILDGCAKSHRLDDAMRVMEEMKSAGIPPSNYTLSILVKLLGHQRRLNHAFSLVEELSSQFGFRPNIQVHTCLAQACFMNRRPERAMQLHDTLVQQNCNADGRFYAALVKGCLQGGSGRFGLMKAVEVVRAAYQLPGHGLATPARAFGVDAKALEEVFMKLSQAGTQEREAVEALREELLRLRGVAMIDGRAGTKHTKK